MKGIEDRQGANRFVEELMPKILFHQHRDEACRRTDRLFAILLAFEWLAGIVMALWISPRTWAGEISRTHAHVYAAVFLGGAISFFPIILALLRPGHILTRYVIAVSQMLIGEHS